MQIIKNKNLKELTTFKIGGEAEFFVEVSSKEDFLLLPYEEFLQ